MDDNPVGVRRNNWVDLIVYLILQEPIQHRFDLVMYYILAGQTMLAAHQLNFSKVLTARKTN